MGELRNFEKIKWKPFQLREGSISVTNYWMDKNGKKKPMQSHLDIPRYSFFEIVKWEPNQYYGKLQEYLNNGWTLSYSGEFLQKDHASINLSFFTMHPETCYMIASWDKIDHDEKTPDLVFVGERPFELNSHEQIIFMQLAKTGQEHIQKVLNDFNEDD